MRRIMLQTVLLAAFTAGPVLAETTTPPAPGNDAPVTAVDRQGFLRMVTSANNWEIQSSELAKRKTEDEALRRFADKIVFDHVGAAVKLKTKLETKPQNAETLPPADLLPKHDEMMRQLEAAAAGPAFDALYLDMQTQAHMEAIALFRGYAGAGDDPVLTDFARETLPSLESHLAWAVELAARKAP